MNPFLANPLVPTFLESLTSVFGVMWMLLIAVVVIGLVVWLIRLPTRRRARAHAASQTGRTSPH